MALNRKIGLNDYIMQPCPKCGEDRERKVVHSPSQYRMITYDRITRYEAYCICLRCGERLYDEKYFPEILCPTI